MEKFLEFVYGFNLQTILSMVLVGWYFARDMKAEIRLLEAKVDAQIAIQSARSDKLYEMFIAANTRISRVEGAVYGKEIYEKIKD